MKVSKSKTPMDEAKIWLLIDDLRNLDNFSVVCRNGEDGIRTITALGVCGANIEMLGIDHDLGNGIDGYEVMKRLAESCHIPKCVQIVSSNPVGREKIERLLEAEGYKKKGFIWEIEEQLMPHQRLKREQKLIGDRSTYEDDRSLKAWSKVILKR